jgi:multicomponent Na+:H+ antiporter subunit E
MYRYVKNTYPERVYAITAERVKEPQVSRARRVVPSWIVFAAAARFRFEPAHKGRPPGMLRVVALFCWTFLVWIVLTWTSMVETLLFGVGVAAAVAVALAPLGDVIRPWRAAHPKRLAAAAWLALVAAGRIVAANLRLSRRIWAPGRPLRSGMVVAATREDSDGGLTAVGLLTSVIVDNQLVDVDRFGHQLQYHAVATPDGDPERVRDAINGPMERLLARLDDAPQRKS